MSRQTCQRSSQRRHLGDPPAASPLRAASPPRIRREQLSWLGALDCASSVALFLAAQPAAVAFVSRNLFRPFAGGTPLISFYLPPCIVYVFRLLPACVIFGDGSTPALGSDALAPVGNAFRGTRQFSSRSSGDLLDHGVWKGN